MCHYMSNFSITKQDIGQFCNLVLSEANLKLDTFHSKCWTCDNLKIFKISM